MPTETIRGHWDRWNWRDIKQVASHRCGFLTTKSSLQAPYTQTSPELAKDVTETDCCQLRWTWLSILPHSGFPTTANTECINLWSRNQNTLFKSHLLCMCAYKHLQHMCGSQKKTCRSHFYLSITEFLEIKFMLSVRIGGKCPKRATFFYAVLKLSM